MIVETMVYKTEPESELHRAVQAAGELLRAGKLVAIPTETVYGLAANALDPEAVNNIFKAKDRPNDNPLIVHIADLSALPDVVSEVPEKARVLMERFWPGPLTIVLPRNPQIPMRLPPAWTPWRCGCPLTRWHRPLSGQAVCPLRHRPPICPACPAPPQPNTASGISPVRCPPLWTVAPATSGWSPPSSPWLGNAPRLLRPGAVTLEQLEAAIGSVEVDHAVTGQLQEGQVAASPGMKYKHYSPKALVYLVRGSAEGFRKYVNALPGEGIYAMVFSGEGEGLQKPFREYGAETDHLVMQARELFWLLREFDNLGAREIYVRCPSTDGVGLAVYNRLIRAAAFKFIDLD